MCISCVKPVFPPPKAFSHLYKEDFIFSFNCLELNEGRGLCPCLPVCVCSPLKRQGEQWCRWDPHLLHLHLLLPSRMRRINTRRRGKCSHVTARCRWWVSPIMAEGPAVRMDCLSHSGACFVSWGRGFVFIFFNVSPQQPGFFSTRRHSSLSAKPWRTAAWICPPCLKRLETSWLSWIWSCLKVKEGRGADGGDAVADCQASCVCLSCLGWPA